MDLGLTGRGALVGGGSSGLGLATAEALAAEGCRLAIWSRNQAGLDTAAGAIRNRYGVEVATIAADAADPAAARSVAEAAAAALGEIDIVVLNAGGPPTVDPTATDPEQWARSLQLLATTPIELATAFLPAMRARSWGRIVGILSSGVRQPIPDLVYSNSGRSALMAWLKTAARAVAVDGVTINGVIPGRLSTPRVASLDAGRAASTGQSIDQVLAGHMATIPAGRYGRPEELAALVAFLCSDGAGYITGTFTAVDGGLIAGLP
ncbi:MAG: SDR family oxidoreductase [Candidatus Limnocylindrales bacterium]